MVRGSGTGSWSSRPWRSRSVLRGESATTYASSKLNRVGRRAARYDSGLSAHRCTRPARKRPAPHRIAHERIACSRSRCGNFTLPCKFFLLPPVNSCQHPSYLPLATPAPPLPHNHARYDALNRLKTLSATSDPSGCNGLSWTYDAWGNRTDQTVTAGSCNTFHATANTANQLVDPVNNIYQYDAAGNMTHDASHTYFYDAENRVAQVDGTFGTCSTATACYLYDADGKRVQKVTGATQTIYLYDLSGKVINEIDGNNVTLANYIYFNGALLAEYKNGTTYFVHKDHLGSTRLVTGLTNPASPVDNLDYSPFGEQIGGSSVTTHKFTGKERDSESGLDNFGARYNSSSMGRFMSPDPVVVTRRRLTDPQRFNLYAYVRNNPLRYTDPTGMDLWEKGCGKESATCHGDYVGSWDKDHKNFTRTTIQTDSHGNIVGHDVNFDSKGIHIDGKYTGVFASKTQATVVNGTGGFEGFQGVFNTNCRGTCAAGGILTALPGHSFDQLASSLRGPNEWGDKFSQHQGDQYRGGNREGVDIHLSYVKGDELQDVHFDWRFPFGSWDGLVEHSRDFMINRERQKTMTSDPPDDLVGPAEP